MSRVIDVSLLPAPTLVSTDYAAEKAARLASLTERFTAAGIPYDVASLESDPGVILQEEDAYRAVLDRAAINDAVRRVLPAFARGADLEHLVAAADIERLVVTPADPVARTPAVYEDDGALLRRYLAAWSVPAAGSREGYIARALAAYPGARDIDVFKTVVDGGPRVNVVLLAPDGDVPVDALAAVYAGLHQPDAAPLTAAISVRAATRVPWGYRARLTLPPGPDPAAVVALARTRLLALADARFHIGGFVPPNAPAGALYAPNVLSVEPLSDFAGIQASPDAAPVLDLDAVELIPVIAR